MDTLVEEPNYMISNSAIYHQMSQPTEFSVVITPPSPTPGHESQLLNNNNNNNNQQIMSISTPGSRRATGDNASLQEMMLASRRPSAIVAALRRPSNALLAQRRLVMELIQNTVGSKQSINNSGLSSRHGELALESKLKNRRIGDDALSTALSALYAKLIVVLGIALPVTDILSYRGPASFYQGFYLYLYLGSVGFVAFMYAAHLRTRAVSTILKTYNEKNGHRDPLGLRNDKVVRYGSFYLRVGAIAFGIGSMVYSGLEFGQYFELKRDSSCQNVLIALTPAARMALSIVQMQFIFLNTKEFEMGKHKVIARFGLMHMVATNLCEWLYVLVEETKHEIVHLAHRHFDHLSESLDSNATMMNSSLSQLATPVHSLTKRATALSIVVDCRRTNIMGTLVQNAAPFLFPCTIEYSLICAVILYEMWKKIKSLSHIQKSRRNTLKNAKTPMSAHHLSVDCGNAHRGMFGGILVIVLTIISLIMYFVLSEDNSYHQMGTLEVTISELILYIITSLAVVGAMLRMRDLKYSQNHSEGGGIGLDCTLLILAQSGVFIYCIFSIIGNYFAINDEMGEDNGAVQGLVAEVFALAQTSLQTMFILNAWWRRCKGAQQNRNKPGREIVTFLLVANMAIWFINTLVKLRASFRPTHLHFFGIWAWTIITHVSMPLAIFYRFHSTICLFEIWKTTYKVKNES